MDKKLTQEEIDDIKAVKTKQIKDNQIVRK